MADPHLNFDPSSRSDPVPGADPPSAACGPSAACERFVVFCRKCNADLTLLPSTARFCNRCGLPLGSAAAASPRPQGDHAIHGGDLAPPGRSLILLAYAKALFNLGWRYEHTPGARRNLREAARCYGKAARIGSSSAVERLGRDSIQTQWASPAPATVPRVTHASEAAAPPPFATVHVPSAPPS